MAPSDAHGHSSRIPQGASQSAAFAVASAPTRYHSPIRTQRAFVAFLSGSLLTTPFYGPHFGQTPPVNMTMAHISQRWSVSTASSRRRYSAAATS